MGSYVTHAEIFGKPSDPQVVRSMFAKLDWELTFKALAEISAKICRQGIMGKFQHEVMHQLAYTKRLDPQNVALALGVAPHLGKRPIFHEQLMYVMFQIAAEECAHGGRNPTYEQLAILGVLLNDHLDTGYENSDTQPEAFASSLALALRYNHNRDNLRDMARIYGILLEPPPTGTVLEQEPDIWREIQYGACAGRSLEDYIALFLNPIALFARAHWGDTDAPAVDSFQWYKNAPELTLTVEAWFEPLTTTADELRATADGRAVPRSPLVLLRKPFVRFGDQYWAATPWAVSRQLHTGVKFRLLQSAKRISKKAEDAFSYGFGLMTEAWSHRLARSANESPTLNGHFSVSDTAGTSEVEDVVWTNDYATVLFSVKSTLIAEADAFNIRSDVGIIDGLEKFLFAPPRKGLRGGAARLLNESVKRVCAGATNLPKNMTIYPIIVMYDEPLENVATMKWLAGRLKAHGLLQQPNVRPLLLCNFDLFETLLFLASKGHDLGHVFEQRRAPKWDDVRLDVYLHSISNENKFRLACITDVFTRVTERSRAILKNEAKIET
jgi:hypothetical protein